MLVALVETSALAVPQQTAPEAVGMSAERLARITGLMQSYVDDDRLAGAVTIVGRHGRVVYHEAVGTLDLEDGNEVEARRPMTIRHLLTHTSGLSYGFAPDNVIDRRYREDQILGSSDLDEMIERLTDIPLRFHPGGRWNYGGALDGTRILSPKTVEFVQQNHLPPGVEYAGGGAYFGLGFAVTTRPGTSEIGSIGSYAWGGAAGTIFWIDPVEDLAVVTMSQLLSSPYPLRAELQALTYAALTELNQH